MATNKPDLTRIWASAAPPSNVVDPDTTTPGKVADGWLAEVPPFEHFNFLQQWFTQGLAHFNEQGIGIWDTNTVYPISGIAKGSDNLLYEAVTEQNDNDPTTDDGTNWILFNPSFNDSRFYPHLTLTEAKANPFLKVGQKVVITDRDEAIFSIVSSMTVTADGYAIINHDTLSISFVIDRKDIMSLKSFGALDAEGEDLSKATTNSEALESAINYISGPFNSTGTTTSKNATITVKGRQYTFNGINIQDKWGWVLDFGNTKCYHNGSFDIGGCAFFDLLLGYHEPVASKTSPNPLTVDFLIMFRSAVANERVHNFYISFKLLAGFNRAMFAGENWSQCVIQGGQFNNNNKCIESSGGGENATLKDWIFANHTNQTSEIVRIDNANITLENWQFETLAPTDRNDMLLVNNFGLKIVNLLMTKSGGIRIEQGEGTIDNARISNSIASTVINHVSGTDWDITNSKIRFDFNNGTGDAFTDGTGKTGIKSLVGFNNCRGNTLRRCDTGIEMENFTIGCSLDDNTINDPKTYAYHLDRAEKIVINGGSVSLDNGTAKGVKVTGINGNGNQVNNVDWGNSPTADRYDLSAGNGQNTVIQDTIIGGDPESAGIIAGSGSIVKVTGQAPGYSVYEKGLFGTGANEWYSLGMAFSNTANLSDISNFVNTVGKHNGRAVKNSSTSQILYAENGNANGRWLDSDGTVVITPV